MERKFVTGPVPTGRSYCSGHRKDWARRGEEIKSLCHQNQPKKKKMEGERTVGEVEDPGASLCGT